MTHASELPGLPQVTREFRGHSYRLPAHPVVLQVFGDEANIRDTYWLIKPGDVVVDVGSHFGSYAIPALASGATVYAVDPDADVSDVLAAIHTCNPELPGRLVMLREALVDKGGLTPFFRSELEKLTHPSMLTPLDCPYSCLDELAEIQGLDRLDWLKIDVEGLELAVLRGGEDALRRFIPTILIEDHTTVVPFVREMQSTRLCTEFLESLGYHVQAGIPYDSGDSRTYILATLGDAE